MTAESENKKWDYVIIGTGMGAGPIGLKLVQAGFSVLFLEKGIAAGASSKGQFAELLPTKSKVDAAEQLKNAGRWSESITDRTHSSEKKLIPFMGSGVGGSSALYGAVLERFKPSDFKTWPVSYQAFVDYYEKAEKLFRVRQPAEFRHPENRILNRDLIARGMHPYHLPLANEDKAECSGCQSFLCAKGCKNDSRRICIDEAVQKYGATVMTNCTVERVAVAGRRAVSVKAKQGDDVMFIEARNIILAAGALMTPVILQNSQIESPSNLIGRNLMRHYVDLYALRIEVDDEKLSTKELGFNDYYSDEGVNLGTVQSFGRLPPVGVLIAQMQKDILTSFGVVVGSLFSLVKPLMKFVLKKVTARRLVMTSIIEDSPQFENRVWSEDGKLCISYRISPADLERIELMRSKLKALFKSYKVLFIKAAEKNEMLAHVCGTCKMGLDPETSVVDTENRLHGYENIYVVDSSFFPTSGGTNPALTIAANSLRVADLLIAKERTIVSSKVERPSL